MDQTRITLPEPLELSWPLQLVVVELTSSVSHTQSDRGHRDGSLTAQVLILRNIASFASPFYNATSIEQFQANSLESTCRDPLSSIRLGHGALQAQVLASIA